MICCRPSKVCKEFIIMPAVSSITVLPLTLFRSDHRQLSKLLLVLSLFLPNTVFVLKIVPYLLLLQSKRIKTPLQ